MCLPARERKSLRIILREHYISSPACSPPHATFPDSLGRRSRCAHGIFETRILALVSAVSGVEHVLDENAEDHVALQPRLRHHYSI
jgi:hypothetical protein